MTLPGASITVIGKGTSSRDPENAKVTLIVQASDISQPGAHSGFTKLTAELEKRLEFSSSSHAGPLVSQYFISPTPDYSEVRPTEGGVPTYHYQTEVQIIFCDIDKMRLLFPRFTNPPEVYLLDIEWQITSETKSKMGTRAREKALKDADHKAEEYADQAFGKQIQLITIKELQSTCEHPQEKPGHAERYPRYNPLSLTPVKFVSTTVVEAEYQVTAKARLID
jgi:uncharacterized protein YggE